MHLRKRIEEFLETFFPELLYRSINWFPDLGYNPIFLFDN